MALKTMSKMKPKTRPIEEPEKMENRILGAVPNKMMKRTMSGNTLNSTLDNTLSEQQRNTIN